MDSRITAVMRDILCSTVSLDDGLSALQGISRSSPESVELAFDIARAIEEIILRRPAIANYKLTELIVRHSFGEDTGLPELLSLLDTRFTNAHRRSETELLPDIEAIPVLMDILGELSQSIITALKMGMRPLLTYLADETLMTLDAIRERAHRPSTKMASSEVYYLTHLLMEEGLFECAEALLNRLMVLSRELELEHIVFEVSLNEARVLTELRLYDQARALLRELESRENPGAGLIRRADIALQLAVNETRDDSVDYHVARDLANQSILLYERAIASGEVGKGELGCAYLTIGSNILASGWREAVPEAIERLEAGLAVCESLPDRDFNQSIHLFKCFAGLGHAHGLLDDHENLTLASEYLKRARSVLDAIESTQHDLRPEKAMCSHAEGWISLQTESNEFWANGIQAFRDAVELRSKLLAEGRVSELSLLGSRVGLALSLMREGAGDHPEYSDMLKEALSGYIPLFPSDSRALTEAAMASYDVVWLALRHGLELSERLRRILTDFDRMITDAQPQESSSFAAGVSLVVPLMEENWSLLRRRAQGLRDDGSYLSGVLSLMAALATAKINLQTISLETLADITSPVNEAVSEEDPLLARYWQGQTLVAQAVRDFYTNKNYSSLATGMYRSALQLRGTQSTVSDIEESTEFIHAAAGSLCVVLLRFALALESHYGAIINRADGSTPVTSFPEDDFSFMLSEDWLGLVKITQAYLQMIEQAEPARAQPYLNAVFSNIARAVRMMDHVGMVERRVLAHLGREMNRRFYLRT